MYSLSAICAFVFTKSNEPSGISPTIASYASPTSNWSIRKVDGGERPPVQCGVLQNYPNPFDDATTITYSLRQAASVHLTIFNAQGQVVEERDLGKKGSGLHQFVRDAEKFSSGNYYCRVATADVIKWLKSILIRWPQIKRIFTDKDWIESSLGLTSRIIKNPSKALNLWKGLYYKVEEFIDIVLFDFDLFRLDLFRLGQRHRQHAVFIIRLDFCCFDAIG